MTLHRTHFSSAEGQASPAVAPGLQGTALCSLVEVEPSTLFRAKGMLEPVVRDSTGAVRDALRALLALLAGAAAQLPA